MSLYYLDSSALVKRYVTETGTRWIQGLTEPSSGREASIFVYHRCTAWNIRLDLQRDDAPLRPEC